MAESNMKGASPKGGGNSTCLVETQDVDSAYEGVWEDWGEEMESLPSKNSKSVSFVEKFDQICLDDFEPSDEWEAVNLPSVSNETGDKVKIQVSPFTNRPKLLWDNMRVQKDRIYKELKPMKWSRRRDRHSIRFVCISDTHDRLHKILDIVPPGDVLIHAGDFTMRGRVAEVARFNEDLGKLPHPIKIVIAGNHELSFDPETVCDPHKIEEGLRRFKIPKGGRVQDLLTNCIYLEDEETTVFGYKVYGSPWQPVFGGWAFNASRGESILEKWDKIPDDTDILVTHGPPLGHGDLARSKQRAGCVELLATIEKRVKPSHHIFGHIHEDAGVTTNGVTTFINASICTIRYKPDQDPIIFELPVKPSFPKSTMKSREENEEHDVPEQIEKNSASE